jgi:hypothetical protein
LIVGVLKANWMVIRSPVLAWEILTFLLTSTVSYTLYCA